MNNLPLNERKAVLISTINLKHLEDIEQGFENKKHVLCEKPLVVVTNDQHRADRSQLNRLEKLVIQNNNLQSPFVLMDAEHYSYKKSTITFFERVGDMVGEYGKISKIEACTKELDDPEKPRTRKILCGENRTGLLLDMGVHLFGGITNINGNIGDILGANYAIYPGHKNCPAYDVETYVKTKFKIKGELFYDNAEGEFEFAKFIDKFGSFEKEDTKQFRISFEKRDGNERVLDSTCVTVDFKKGTVTDDKGKEWYGYSQPSSNEYVNILKEFYNAIIRNQQPRTSFERSIKNLGAIYSIYKKFPVEKNIMQVYN